MNTYLFLLDLKNYCDYNNISFKDMSKKDIKLHIRRMCKQIAKGSHIKLRCNYEEQHQKEFY